VKYRLSALISASVFLQTPQECTCPRIYPAVNHNRIIKPTQCMLTNVILYM